MPALPPRGPATARLHGATGAAQLRASTAQRSALWTAQTKSNASAQQMQAAPFSRPGRLARSISRPRRSASAEAK